MSKRRWLLPAMLVLVLALVGAACGDDDEPTVTGDDTAEEQPEFAAGTTMAAIQERGRIIVGTKFDQPGLGQSNPLSGEVEGFDVEIAKLIAAAIFGVEPDDLGDRIEFVETPTPVREQVIENGTVDIVVATYTINDARKERIDFAGPYYVAVQDIMVREGDESITGVDSLAGRTVCSVRDSTPARRIREQAPEATLIEYSTYSQCKDDLLNNRVDAVSTDDVILYGFESDEPDRLEVVGNPFSEEPYGIGLAKGDDAFREFINDRLEEIYESSEWKAAFERTLGALGVPTPEDPPEVDRYTSTAAGGAATTAEATTTTAEATTTTAEATTTTAEATTTTTG